MEESGENSLSFKKTKNNYHWLLFERKSGTEHTELEWNMQSPRLKTTRCWHISQHLRDLVAHFKQAHKWNTPLIHAQTHNHVHIVTSALLNLATVLSRCNKCLRVEAWEVFPQIRDTAAVSDYLSAVMELCSQRLSLFLLLPKAATGDHRCLAHSLLSLWFSSKQRSPPSDACLLFARMLRQLRPLKAPDLKVANATTKLDFRQGMCPPQ